MGEKIAFQNNRISDFLGLVTLTLTLDRVILHTFITSAYTPNFIESKKVFVDVRTFETGFTRSTPKSWRKKQEKTNYWRVNPT